MYASVTIIGNLGKDPEMRFTPNGNAVTNFSVAVTRKTKKNDEPYEETNWWGVSVWGSQGESCNQYLAKGKRVMVVGYPRIRTWDRDDGTQGSRLEVTADRVVFLSPKADPTGGMPEAYESEDLPF